MFVKRRVKGGELSALTEEGWHVCNRRTKQWWHCVYGVFLLQKSRRWEKKSDSALTNAMCSPITDSSAISSCQANQSSCLRKKEKSEICTEMESFLYLLEDQGVLCHPFDLVHPSTLWHHLTLVHPKCKSKCQFWLLSRAFQAMREESQSRKWLQIPVLGNSWVRLDLSCISSNLISKTWQN